jgi:hypothetical protein
MAHDPIVEPTVREAEHLEPRFVHPEQEAVANERLTGFSRDGKRRTC